MYLKEEYKAKTDPWIMSAAASDWETGSETHDEAARSDGYASNADPWILAAAGSWDESEYHGSVSSMMAPDAKLDDTIDHDAEEEGDTVEPMMFVATSGPTNLTFMDDMSMITESPSVTDTLRSNRNVSTTASAGELKDVARGTTLTREGAGGNPGKKVPPGSLSGVMSVSTASRSSSRRPGELSQETKDMYRNRIVCVSFLTLLVVVGVCVGVVLTVGRAQYPNLFGGNGSATSLESAPAPTELRTKKPVPTAPYSAPSTIPSFAPSGPTQRPSMAPSITPPSTNPSVTPSESPSMNPSNTVYPSLLPSSVPSITMEPSHQPSSMPSLSSSPTVSMTPTISVAPSRLPSVSPSRSIVPSYKPSFSPSAPPSTQMQNMDRNLRDLNFARRGLD